MIQAHQIKKGQTVYEEYYSYVRKCNITEFNYRALDGVLFTCSRQTLEECQKALDQWLVNTGRK